MGCFEDSCSVKWQEVTTGSGRKYEASLELAENGSIKCSEDAILDVGVGLFVDLLDDNPIDTTRQCANILRRTSAGELYAVLPQVETATSNASSYASVPQTADAGSPAAAGLNFSFNNNTDCPVLIVLRGQFELAYDILSEVSPVANTPGQLRRISNLTTNASVGTTVQETNLTPYNAQWIARLRRQITGATPAALASVVAHHFNTAGVVADANPNNTLQSEWRDFTWIEELGANSTMTFTGDVFFDGPEQTINVVAAPASDAPARGFRIHNNNLFVLPMQVL